MEIIQAELMNALVGVVIALIGLAATWITVKISQVSNALQEHSKNELLDRTIERAERLARNIVTRIEEETAKYLREAVKDGKIDRSELTELGNVAYTSLVNQLGVEGVMILQESLGDINDLLRDIIERQVIEVKVEMAAREVMEHLNVEAPKA